MTPRERPGGRVPERLSGTQWTGAGPGWAQSSSRRSSSLETITVVGEGEMMQQATGSGFGAGLDDWPPETLCMASNSLGRC